MSQTGTLIGCAVIALVGIVLLPPTERIRRFAPRRSFNLNRRTVPVLWGALVGSSAAVIAHRLSALLLLACLGGALGLGLSKIRERSAQRASEREIADQLPVVIEMLALAISAGEAPASALARISQHGNGALLHSLRGATSDLALGSTLAQALAGVRREIPSTDLDRFIDGITTGRERGTPLVDLLHAQALDARERQRRALIEKAASSEVAMMIPVVFLIMPVTIVFALFPSLYRMTWM